MTPRAIAKAAALALSPCPFCGRWAHMARMGIAGVFFVSCSGSWFGAPGKGCGARGPDYRVRWRAVKAWNRRAVIR